MWVAAEAHVGDRRLIIVFVAKYVVWAIYVRVLSHPVHSLNDVGHVSGALAVEHLHPGQRRGESDAYDILVVVPGGHGTHVVVAVPVLSASEVDGVNHVEIGVVPVYARVDDIGIEPDTSPSPFPAAVELTSASVRSIPYESVCSIVFTSLSGST